MTRSEMAPAGLLTYACAAKRNARVPMREKPSWPALSAKPPTRAPPTRPAAKRTALFEAKLSWLAQCTGLARPIIVRTTLPVIGRVYYATEEPSTARDAIAMLDTCWEHICVNWGSATWNVAPLTRLLNGEVGAAWVPLSHETIHRLESECAEKFEMSSMYIIDAPVRDTGNPPVRPADGVRLQHMTKLRALRPRLFFGYQKWQYGH